MMYWHTFCPEEQANKCWQSVDSPQCADGPTFQLMFLFDAAFCHFTLYLRPELLLGVQMRRVRREDEGLHLTGDEHQCALLRCTACLVLKSLGRSMEPAPWLWCSRIEHQSRTTSANRSSPRMHLISSPNARISETRGNGVRFWYVLMLAQSTHISLGQIWCDATL